ncbi:hypothetical protein GQ472_03115 [archaeon]|nr:hypothetical protein [archaeon]
MIEKDLIISEEIRNRIYTIRGLQVMTDRDLASLYDVETRILNQAVKRNSERFPEEYCFQLNDEEFSNWISQIVMSNEDKMGLRRHPYVFTEQRLGFIQNNMRFQNE